jgi:hypothetical protein
MGQIVSLLTVNDCEQHFRAALQGDKTSCMNNSLIVRENGKLAFQSRYGLNGPESLNLLREDAKSPQGDSEFSIPSSFLQAKRV